MFIKLIFKSMNIAAMFIVYFGIKETGTLVREEDNRAIIKV